ncbi:MAG: sugar phosphate isomerase/epimerase [Proteobacteria bacterium]|nr:sugar phosphate isomerase/epimerase [Pseudomonadota bacterium]
MSHAILDRVSYHAVYDDSILSALRFASKNGFKGVQVAVETPHLSFELLSRKDTDTIRDFSVRNGIQISLHAPDDVTSLFAHNDSLRQGILEYYTGLFDFAESLKARLVTIHMGSMTIFPTDSIPEETVPEIDLSIYLDTVHRHLDDLIELSEGRFILCIENYRLDSAVLPLLQNILEEKQLFLCWDIAKSHGNKELEQYFWSNINAIKQVHLHDRRWIDNRIRSHRVIGSGEIDFGQYLSRMQDENILDYCIEVRPRDKALESLENLKTILAGP